VHVPKEKRKALDDRSEKCILIGYGSGNIYRLLTKKTRKLIIARNVKFDESLLGFDNSETRSNHYTSMMMMMMRKRTRKLLLKILRNLLARNLRSRKQKKCNQC